ncbi:riboflavin synthase [Aquisediminimonas sediminicola]|uniref:riboflavin synthase n=1 Tax=Alteraquisediminimonas sediminicola TaxID=2676787 RepID=UPI001C8E4FDF|nr:riboflavin synthase [Aquisediminimonas sediminicola]
MFTGIISDIGTIRKVEQRGDLRAEIACGYEMGGVDIGASIACSGVCLTVVSKTADSFTIDISAESLSRTAPGLFVEGNRLNLERALKLGDELGGHIVTGHVDGVGEVIAVEPKGDSHKITIRAPKSLAAFIAPKGSITLDGISLTVNDVMDEADGHALFTINIIPHTWEMTTFSSLTMGRKLNIEIDVLARYLQRMQSVRG